MVEARRIRAIDHACNGFSAYPTAHCCFRDPNGSLYCAQSCINSSMCGSARCVTYPSGSTTCTSRLGCGIF